MKKEEHERFPTYYTDSHTVEYDAELDTITLYGAGFRVDLTLTETPQIIEIMNDIEKERNKHNNNK